MRYYNKSKKGSSLFILLTSVFCVILLFIAMLSIGAKPERSIDDTNFGKITQETDMIVSKIPAEELYKTESIKYVLEKAKVDFAHDSRIPECNVGELSIWYNQWMLDMVEEGEEYIDCLPKFDGDIDVMMSKYLNKSLRNSLDEISTGLRVDYDIKASFDEESKMFAISADSSFSHSTSSGFVTYRSDYLEEFDLGTYPMLLESLVSKIEELPEAMEKDVPVCVKNSESQGVGNLEINCISDTVKNVLKDDSKLFWKDYDMKVYVFNSPYTQDYYGVRVQIDSKKKKAKEMEFGMIFKDNIPYHLIDFELSNFEKLDNVVTVSIEKPKFATDDIVNYVVLYSYEDFFDENNPNFEKLIGMLSNSNIPVDFEEDSIVSSGMSFYHSKPEDNLDLNLIVINNDGFKEFGSGDDLKLVKDVELFQNYDFENAKYELLKPNKDLFVYVFAVDKLYNYYVEDIAGLTEWIVVEPQIGPERLIYNKDVNLKNTVEFSGDITGEQNAFYFDTSKYEDESFHHYDIYIGKNSFGSVNKGCEGMDDCFYFDGTQFLTQRNGKFVVGSYGLESERLAELGIDRFVNSNDFFSGGGEKLILLNGETYYVLVAPVDAFGNSMLSQFAASYRINKVGDYFELEDISDNSVKYRPQIVGVKIGDDKNPDVANSYTLGEIGLEGNSLILMWDGIDNLEEIDYLQGVLTLTDVNGGTSMVPNAKLGKDQVLMHNIGEEIVKVRFDSIIPYDLIGNGYELSELNAEQRARLKYKEWYK